MASVWFVVDGCGLLGCGLVAVMKLVRLRLGVGKTVGDRRKTWDGCFCFLFDRLCYSLRQSRHHWLVVNRVAVAELAADV